MSRVCLPCNLTEQEQQEAMRKFGGNSDFLTAEEEEAISEVFTQYLFYETWGSKNKRECICTHVNCGAFDMYAYQNKQFFRHKHNESIECPRCGEPVTLKALGKLRSGSSLTETRRVTICRACQDGSLLLISGWATKRYDPYHDLRPGVDWDAKTRTYLRPGKRMQWKRGRVWDGTRFGYLTTWYPCPTVQEPFSPFMYSSDGSYYLIHPGAIYDTELRYCQLDQFFRSRKGIDILEPPPEPIRGCIKYLSAYTGYPQIEMAVKIGMTDAVAELVKSGQKYNKQLNWRAKTIPDFLRLTKPDAKIFIQIHGDLDLLTSFKRAFVLKRVQNMSEFKALADLIGGYEEIPVLVYCCEMSRCKLKKGARYVDRPDCYATRSHKLTAWRDYLDMARKLGYDLTRPDVAMPHNLRERHDAAADTIRANADTIEMTKYENRLKILRKLYEFELNGLRIVVPSSYGEIVDEGKTLHHCVAGYAGRHIQGKVDILFLRRVRRPGVPFVTIEMKPRKSVSDKVQMVQIHGYRNEFYNGKHGQDPYDKYSWFLSAWIDWMRAGSKRDKSGKPILPGKEQTA